MRGQKAMSRVAPACWWRRRPDGNWAAEIKRFAPKLTAIIAHPSGQ